jgi:membrane-anchored protein YejM (alkaline phosphatase superfamily)
VLVLADDLDWSLWNAVPRLRNLETQGTTLTNDVVSDSVDAVRASLAASRHTDDTLVIVTSDNGLPVGSDRTHRGKRSAFDADTVVPMVAIGPGVPAGQVVSRTPPGRPGPRGVLACCPKASA